MSGLSDVLHSQLGSVASAEFPQCAASTLDAAVDARRDNNLHLWRVVLGITFGRLIRNHGRNINDVPPFTDSDYADNAGEILISLSYAIPRLFNINLDKPRCKAAKTKRLGQPSPANDCESNVLKRYRINKQTIENRDDMGCLLRDSRVPAFKLRQLNNIQETILLEMLKA